MESLPQTESSEKYLERAIESNDEFLEELRKVETLEELKGVLHDLAYVTTIDGNRCSVIPEITPIAASEDVEVKVYLEDDLVRSIGVFIGDPVTDVSGLEQEVRNWIDHRDVADAVIRIITQNINA
jgi:hypothetical protein